MRLLMASLNSFLRGRRGSTSAMFGLAALPCLVAAGVAVEYSHLVGAKTELQALSDAAALAAASAYADGNDDYAAIAENYINKNKSDSGPLTDVVVDPTVTPNDDDQTMTVESTVDIPTVMGNVLGRGLNDIHTKSTASLPIFSEHNKGEIVLVMDYSGSMEETVNGVKKYRTMRDETVNLIEELSQDGTNLDVKFGLVPFSDMVRITMAKKYYNGQTTSSDWTRCVSDRKYPYNTRSTTPTTGSTSNTTKFIDEGSCSSTYGGNYLNVRDLTTSHSSTISQIQNMQPHNLTHIALGMEWAFHVLSPNVPYTSGTSFGTEGTLKAVVLLTDGRQTADGWGPGNNIWDRSPEQAEENLDAICASLKDEGVRVITVSFDLNDSMEAETETRLRDCAGDINEPDGTYYFNTDTNDELADAFGVIKDALARNMYLSE